jgi:hypothetical protein
LSVTHHQSQQAAANGHVQHPGQQKQQQQALLRAWPLGRCLPLLVLVLVLLSVARLLWLSWWTCLGYVAWLLLCCDSGVSLAV